MKYFSLYGMWSGVVEWKGILCRDGWRFWLGVGGVVRFG